jgi:glycosyltransferase involved in cell wall biosynthesis
MKVLYVTSVYPRWEGDSTPPFVQNQAELMTAQGHEIRVLAPHSAGAARAEDSGLLSVRRFVYALPISLQQLCYEGGMLVQLHKGRWKCLLLPLFLTAEMLAVFRECLRWKPDIIHSHSLLPQGLVCLVAARLWRIPHVCTSHGNDVFGLKATGCMGALKRLIINLCDHITVNSEATKAKIQELTPISERRISLIPAVPNVGSIDEELVRNIHTSYPSGHRLLFVGRLIEEKGVFDLLEVMKDFLPRYPEWSLIMVGDGVARTEIVESMAAADLKDRIHLVGWRPRHEIPSWMAACHGLLMPTWREAQGLVIVEAMAVGTPVIASRIGGIVDMVIPGQTGMLFEARNHSNMLECLEAFVGNPDASNDLAKNALQHYTNNYSPEHIAHATDHLYRQLGPV